MSPRIEDAEAREARYKVVVGHVFENPPTVYGFFDDEAEAKAWATRPDALSAPGAVVMVDEWSGQVTVAQVRGTK